MAYLSGMKKKQILLSVIAVAAVAVLFSLPKVVVDNEGRNNNLDSRQDEAAIAGDAAVTASAGPHTAEIPENARLKIDSLREKYKSSANSEKSAIFAASLAEAYKSIGLYDSAASYASELAGFTASLEDQKRAGDLYYEAYSHAVDANKANELGEKARFFYEKALEQSPDDLEVKAKMAMTYMSTSNPMRGIQMLREVLAKDENNEMAILNLGLLSLQSGQHKKAAERFEKLTSLNPAHLQAQYWLGVSYFESGKKQKAKAQFEKVLQMDSDPEIKASVENYLSRI